MPEFNIIAEYIPSRTITAQFIPVNFDIPAKLVEKTIQANGVYNASEDNVDGYSSVTVVVPDRPLMVQELNVTPSTESQTINIVSGIDGYGPVNVAAVTSDIDSNIKSENIKEGIAILGTTGNVVELNGETRDVSITSTSGNTFTPSENKNAITSITVTPTNQNKTIDATTSEQTINVPEGYSGHGTITVNPVTASVDPNIQPTNIREGVDILGVTGTAHVPEKYIEFNLSNTGELTKKAKLLDLTGVSSVASKALFYAYNDCVFDTNTHIDLSGIHIISASGCYGMFSLATGITTVDMSGFVGAMNYCCASMFQNCYSLTSIDLSSLQQIKRSYSFDSTFLGCSSLRTVNLSSLRIINATNACNYMFKNCNSLQAVDLSSLTVIWNNSVVTQMFSGCAALKSVNMSSLTILGGSRAADQMFVVCGALTDVDLSSLKRIRLSNACVNMFQGCTSLTTLSFPALLSEAFTGYTNQFSGLLQGVTGCTIHFPKNLDPQTGSTVISSLSGYPNFGGTNTALVFDLPSTLVLTGTNGVGYERNPKYDTEGVIAWRIADTGSTEDPTIDWTPYYTNGTADPQVGDTIYSDSACTQAVTTIGAIA